MGHEGGSNTRAVGAGCHGRGSIQNLTSLFGRGGTREQCGLPEGGVGGGVGGGPDRTLENLTGLRGVGGVGGVGWSSFYEGGNWGEGGGGGPGRAGTPETLVALINEGGGWGRRGGMKDSVLQGRYLLKNQQLV